MKRNVLFITLAALAIALPVLALAVTHHLPHNWLAYLATGAIAFGTVTVTQITTGDLPSNDRQSWTIISTSDTDTQTGAIAHVMGVNPLMVLTPIGAAAALAGWYQVTLSSTQWGLNKSTAAGSGATTATVEVTVIRRR